MQRWKRPTPSEQTTLTQLVEAFGLQSIASRSTLKLPSVFIQHVFYYVFFVAVPHSHYYDVCTQRTAEYDQNVTEQVRNVVLRLRVIGARTETVFLEKQPS